MSRAAGRMTGVDSHVVETHMTKAAGCGVSYIHGSLPKLPKSIRVVEAEVKSHVAESS